MGIFDFVCGMDKIFQIIALFALLGISITTAFFRYVKKKSGIPKDILNYLIIAFLIIVLFFC